eukprot:scaffold142564_cov23-Tisochrysis_lutea.AAC.3
MAPATFLSRASTLCGSSGLRRAWSSLWRTIPFLAFPLVAAHVEKGSLFLCSMWLHLGPD